MNKDNAPFTSGGGAKVPAKPTEPDQPKEVVFNDTPTKHAEVVPPGTAPRENLFTPNPIGETPGQADNPASGSTADKEDTSTDPLDFPGATSGTVHQGLGHPGAGQTSRELKQAKAEHTATNKGPAQGGSGMTDEGDIEARKLQEEHTKGPLPDREHNTNLAGSESILPQDSEQVASRENTDGGRY